MALTNETIQAGRSNNQKVRTYCSQLVDECRNISVMIDSDANFQIFSGQTGLGKRLSNQLNDLVVLLQGSVSDNINQIVDATDKFLNRQEELNNKSS